MNRRLRKRGAIPYPVWRSKCNFPRKIIPRIRATEATEAPKSLSATPLSKMIIIIVCLRLPTSYHPIPFPLTFPSASAAPPNLYSIFFSETQFLSWSIDCVRGKTWRRKPKLEIGLGDGPRKEGREEEREGRRSFCFGGRKSNQGDGGEVWRRRSGAAAEERKKGFADGGFLLGHFPQSISAPHLSLYPSLGNGCQMPIARTTDAEKWKEQRSCPPLAACSPFVTVGQVHRFRHRTMLGKQRLKFIHSLRIYAQPHPVNMISKSVLSLYLATPAAVAALFVPVSTDHDDDSSMGKPPAPNWPTLRCHKWMRTIQSAPRAPLRKRESQSSGLMPALILRCPPPLFL